MSGALTPARSGTFVRDNLPDPTEYFESFGPVTGKGLQRGGPCIIHGGRKTNSFHAESGAWLCRSCNARGGDVLSHYMQAHGVGFVEAAKRLGAWQENRSGVVTVTTRRAVRPTPRRSEVQSDVPAFPAYGSAVLQPCIPLAGTLGAEYLLSRGCAIPPADSDLLFHPALPHPSGHVGPALFGKNRHALTGALQGLTRGWINANGSKADVDPPRMNLGPKKCGVIKLWSDDYVTHGLAIAEGTETALSMAHDYKPVWSCIDAGNLAAFPVLPGIETLVIGADHDPAGLKAAIECAERWAAAGVDVRVIAPDTEHADWNDARATV